MKKEFVVFGLIMSIFLIGIVSAGSCGDDDRIMKLYQSTNSHGALWNDATYTYDICYSDIFGVVYAGDLPTVHDCDGSNKIIGLYSASNSHAQNPLLDTYPIDVCYGDLDCELEAGFPSGPCDNGGESVLRIKDHSNSHISDASDLIYGKRICCKSSGGIPPIIPPTGNAYWADMQGNAIISAEIGDTVLMIYENMAGGDYDFEVYEKDDISFDDEIRTVSETFDFGAHLAAKWEITQEDWEKDLFGDPEFIFKVDIEESGELDVPADSYGNFPPTTELIKPVAETNYIIKQGQSTTNPVSFEQKSYDEDDDLKVIWEFGDRDTEEILGCLSGVNCNTTHEYSSAGTKNIVLKVQEMSERTLTTIPKDSLRIYVYAQGLNAYVVMDKTINSRVVEIDATQTHVSDCDYLQTTCEGKYSGCYEVVDDIEPTESLWCYDLALRVDGIDANPNLFLDWTADGEPITPVQIGNEMKYRKIFDAPGDYIINLNVQYKL